MRPLGPNRGTQSGGGGIHLAGDHEILADGRYGVFGMGEHVLTPDGVCDAEALEHPHDGRLDVAQDQPDLTRLELAVQVEEHHSG